MPRFRRETPDESQRSVVLQTSQPLIGPARHPTLDLNYNHRLIDNGNTNLHAFGGANLYEGHVSPQVGVAFEHNINEHFFINGRGQVQPGPHGEILPTINAGVGWRFRRDAPEPQESIGVQCSKSSNCPHKNPSLDVTYHQRLIDNEKTKLEVSGGANINNRGRIIPRATVSLTHNFNKNLLFHGRGQVQPKCCGGMSPSFNAVFEWKMKDYSCS